MSSFVAPRSVLFVSLLLATACSDPSSGPEGSGGSGGSGTPSGCSMTIEGAVSGASTECFVVVGSTAYGSFSFHAEPGTSGADVELAGAVVQFDDAPAPGEYSNDNAFSVSAQVTHYDGTQYGAFQNTNTTLPTVGSVKFVITSIESIGGLLMARGTMAATLGELSPDGKIVEGTTVTLTAKF
jgi:hypothetical protein